MGILRVAMLALTCLGCGYYIMSTWLLCRHFLKKRRGVGDVGPLPSVSILKPVCGIDADTRKNLEASLSQDYPDYETLYGVADEDDPAFGLINDLIQTMPRASLHVGSSIAGANNKVRILHTLAQHATGEIVVIADADTRVRPDCLRRVCAPFSDPSVGVVTCMYRGVGAKSLADAIEGLHMTCVFQPGVACADYLGAAFGLGAVMAVRSSALNAIGGFRSLVDYLADDYQLACRIARTGLQVVLSDYVVDIVLSGDTPQAVGSRLMRWMQTQRVCNPGGYLGLASTYGTAWSVLFAATVVGSPVAWLAILGTAAVRVATGYAGARICLDDREFPRRVAWLPVCDAVSFTLWLAAFLTRTVTWRGRRLRLSRDGRISPFGV
jgi:ceramide glucosyltransferase